MATNSIWTTRRGVHHRELAGEQPERTEIRLAEGELAGHGRPGSTSVPAKTRSAAPRSISDGPFLSNFPTSAPSASPTVQRQPMPLCTCLCLPAFPSRSNHPTQLTHTSGTHLGKAAYRGVDRPKPSQFSGRRSAASTGEMGAV